MILMSLASAVFVLGNCVEADAKINRPGGLEHWSDVLRKEIGAQVFLGMLKRVKAMDDLYILVVGEQLFGECAFDLAQEGLRIVEEDFCCGWSLVCIDKLICRYAFGSIVVSFLLGDGLSIR